ncbi:hypothetical protein QTP88_021608 [Uroleucon formosanum]
MTYEAKPNSSSNILKCDRKLVKLSCSSNAIEGVSLLDESILNTASSICSEPFSNNKVSLSCRSDAMEGGSLLDESPLIVSSKVNKDDTPRRLFLKHGIRTLSVQVKIKNKQLKSLQQTIKARPHWTRFAMRVILSSDFYNFGGASSAFLLFCEAKVEMFKERLWVHELNKNRETEGEYHILFSKLKKHPDKFFEYCRMDEETFNLVLDAIKDTIQKSETNFRKPISPEETLLVTLR